MPYDALSIANYFIELACREKLEVTHLKLQKLVYYAHGWSLAIFDEPLIDEPFQAWQHGPVAPDLYMHLKQFGKESITRHVTRLAYDGTHYYKEIAQLPSDPEICELLDVVHDKYKDYSGGQLTGMTHKPGTPWHIATDGGKKNRFSVISDESIKAYFQGLMRRNAARHEA